MAVFDGFDGRTLLVHLRPAPALPRLPSPAWYGRARRLSRLPSSGLGRHGTGVHGGTWHAARCRPGRLLERAGAVDIPGRFVAGIVPAEFVASPCETMCDM